MKFNISLAVEVYDTPRYQTRRKIERIDITYEQASQLVRHPERGAPLLDMAPEWLYHITVPRGETHLGVSIWVPIDTRTFDPSITFLSWWLAKEASYMNTQLDLGSETIEWLNTKLFYDELRDHDDGPVRVLVAVRKEEE